MTDNDHDVTGALDLNAIIERLKDILGVDDEQTVAEAIGMSRTALAERKRRESIPFANLHDFARQRGVHYEWLLSGDGPKFRQDFVMSKDTSAVPPPDPTNFSLVRKVRAELSAGDGSWITDADTTQFYAFRTDWIKQKGSGHVSAMVLMEVSGNSMVPTIQNGDHVLVDEGLTTPRNGAIMVIGAGEEIFVKRIRSHLDGTFDLLCDNPDATKYPPLGPFKREDIRFLGKVLWIGRELP